MFDNVTIIIKNTDLQADAATETADEDVDTIHSTEQFQPDASGLIDDINTVR